jgi:diguanylate cyclase (GGDEF)-like protein
MLEYIGRVIPFHWGVIWLKNPRTGDLEARRMLNASGEEWPAPIKPPPVVLRAAQIGSSQQSPVASQGDGELLDGPTALLELATPLSSRGEVLGVISMCTTMPDGYSAGQRLLLETLAGSAAIAIQNAELYTQTQRLATKDGLTHLYNHRSLQQKLLEEENRSKRYHRHFALILLDIDLFKTYNDTFGHPAGDQLLVALGRILQSSVRRVDFVARYGGEEFAIVLPECDKERALVVAERIRVNVEEFPNPNGEHFNLTISAGVSSFPVDGESREEVLEKADKALYEAKRRGRNMVCK